MHALYLSNRPAVMAETLSYVTRYMPWVGPITVIAPESGDYGDTATVVTEAEILSPSVRSQLASMDHVTRNITLRRAAVDHLGLDGFFLLSDDDYRPLTDISPETFVDGGRMHGYVSHDLATWRQADTDYDHAQRRTYSALLALGAPHLGYGAHMPQAMHADVWHDAFAQWDRLTLTASGAPDGLVDEWSLHHNWGRHAHPERFFTPRRFRTLAWPQFPHEWPRTIRPTQIQFENHYPELYQPNALFDGLSHRCDPETDPYALFAKIDRWNALDIELDRGGALHVATPWNAGAVRKGARALAKTAGRARRLLSMTDTERYGAASDREIGRTARLDTDQPADHTE